MEVHLSYSLFVNKLPSALRVALLRDGRLEAFSLLREEADPAIGSTMLGRVVNVHAAIGAAFLEVGGERNVFLDRRDLPRALAPESKAPIEDVLKEGRDLLVQVRKQSFGEKLMQVSAELKLVGFHLILQPYGRGITFSRAFAGDRETAKACLLPFNWQGGGPGWIVRTAAAARDSERLALEAERLLAQFASFQAAAQSGKPRLIEALDPLLALLREIPHGQLKNLHFDDIKLHDRIKQQLLTPYPELALRLKLHGGEHPLFDVYKIESEIDQLTANRVWLKSGGCLDFHQTPAMVTVDVNSGKNTRARSGISCALKTNLEAVDEVTRQLRARNLAGLVVIDFINAPESNWRKQIDTALSEAIGLDPARVEMLPTNRFGLGQLSRARKGTDLNRILHEPCRTCSGSGWVDRLETIALQIQRQLRRQAPGMEGETFLLRCGQALADYLMQRHALFFEGLEQAFEIQVTVEKRNEMQARAWRLEL